ncbi:MAG: carboxypeptidase-like regulatory domain-containing protein, partial [Bacteroidales bacterium]|nr:carboxypeptidase-like regulatory domain-containing protein [Bacteroidales bacterium]
MNRLKLLLALFVFTGFSALMAQTVAIKGTVTSADDGLSIPSVAVTVRGTTIGTLTDINGTFTINAPVGANQLVFQFVGMKTITENISGRTTVDVVMVTDMLGLEEVVVTALGISREKKALGYSVQD